MIRLFTAVTLPEQIIRRLGLLGGGIPGARWVAAENLHMTLRFIGDVDSRTADQAHQSLREVAFAPFDLQLRNVEIFGDRRPRLLYAGVEPSEPLMALYARINAAHGRAGLPPPEERRYVPHVTLARLRNPPRDRLAAFIAAHNILALPAFRVENFALMSSHRSAAGASYQIEALYPCG
ncbi:MAG TPA: RNA 2',3'-cyclic phosphodiesterase [Alphaproteobacteria bacterium]|nr:RNA 2',3'-cyclic phosphodiesterase [Alphaproteobacteria bacterium]